MLGDGAEDLEAEVFELWHATIIYRSYVSFTTRVARMCVAGGALKKWAKWAAIAGVALILWSCGSSEAPHFANASTIKRLDGSTIAASEVDATVNRMMRDAKVTGVGLAIINDGKIVYLNAYGKRKSSPDLPLQIDTIMSAASFTKVAFAYMVMQLVQEGVIDLDKPAYQYIGRPLPEKHNYKDLAGDERYKKITPRMLLDHTSGFPNWRYFADDKKLSINFEPGTKFAYSGEGIDLLQVVVEAAMQKSVADLMNERVFVPLGMKRTSMTWTMSYERNSADGFDEQGNSLGPQRRMFADAAGSMKTTPEDFALFLQAVGNGIGLRKETKELMLNPQVEIKSAHEFPTLAPETTTANDTIRLSYGLGWGLYWTPYGKVFFKEGHDDGWRNYAVYFDDAKTGMVIMTNSSNGEGIYKELLETLQKNSFTPIEWERFTPYDH
jgi:CubicO group peptidase (beta-lactamase class C family)